MTIDHQDIDILQSTVKSQREKTRIKVNKNKNYRVLSMKLLSCVIYILLSFNLST